MKNDKVKAKEDYSTILLLLNYDCVISGYTKAYIYSYYSMDALTDVWIKLLRSWITIGRCRGPKTKIPLTPTVYLNSR